MGVRGKAILNNAKREGIQVIQGKQKNTYPIQLVPESFIRGLMVSHECEVGEKVEIDGIMHVGVTKKQEVMGIRGETILNNAKKDGIQVIQGKQKKNGFSVHLVPESFIRGLMVSHECEVGGKVEIDGIMHIGIVATSEVM